jgi:AcrR family transcriptional regulator
MSPTKPQNRGLARRQAMLDAASELFLSKGFERTSLSDILERSKGSRSTLYEQFGNKEGLLKAIIDSSLEGVRNALDGEEDISELNEDGLTQLGLRFMRQVIEPTALGVFRLLVSEGHRLPEISAFTNESCQQDIDARLADIFRRRLPAAQSKPEAATELAIFFLWSVTGDIHFQHAVGNPPALSDDEMEALVRTRVRLFLYGINGVVGTP